MPRVYITQDKGYDFGPAKVYGELVVLFEGQVDEFFNVLVGNTLPNSIVFSLVMENYGHVNLLLYDAKNSSYVPRLLARHHVDNGRR
jgi:hypothetical protein